jgi:hypothetical protein
LTLFFTLSQTLFHTLFKTVSVAFLLSLVSNILKLLSG